jgi:hypothetical protein
MLHRDAGIERDRHISGGRKRKKYDKPLIGIRSQETYVLALKALGEQIRSERPYVIIKGTA